MKNYRTLDAIVVCGALAVIGFCAWSLVFRIVPQPNLPILAGLIGTVFGGTIGLYSGARWGNKKTDEPTAPSTGGNVSLSLTASDTKPTDGTEPA